MKKRCFWKSADRQRSGQISVLFALIFPVLFVFFAMTINIGLVVHDKINLQNSADLAAYYAAQKQAEVLNAIAHLNYQIRQHWKLLAFRIRGFGSMGLGSDPTGSPQPFHPFRSRNAAFDGGWREVPTVCTQVASFWKEKFFQGDPYDIDSKESLCQIQDPTIFGIRPPIALSFNPGFNEVVRAQSIARLADQEKACMLHGTTNWIVATTWFRAYIKALYHRKKAIKELAEKLRDGLDLRDDPIEAGARQTFRNNLTRSNREAFDDSDFQLFNSMEGVEWNEWLVERPLYTVVYYTDSEWKGVIADGNNCDYKARPHFNAPEHRNEVPEYQAPDIQDRIQDLEIITQQKAGAVFPGEPPDLNLNTIIGYEKNPWYMVYSGVHVRASPRQPFTPFVGDDNVLTMSARAFAKPFGGKIGPWMYESWPRNSNVSDEGSRQIDTTLPHIRDESGDFTLSPPFSVGESSPNYARYPGDTLGLKSFAALRIYRDSLLSTKLSHLDFIERDDFIPPEGAEVKYDPLAWRIDASNHFILARAVEVMAVSPDLFDITYYSIDPRFYRNHDEISTRDLLFRRTTLDIGGSPDLPKYDPNIFGVLDQWVWANNLGQDGDIILPDDIGSSYTPVGSLPSAPWFVKDWKHLLTGWVPDPESQFGKCDNEGDLTLKAAESLPGSCAIGGRMGYSVKLISKRYLTSDLLLGNDGASGKIIRPPPF